MPVVHICNKAWQDLLYAESMLEDYVNIETPNDVIKALVDILEEWNEFKEGNV